MALQWQNVRIGRDKVICHADALGGRFLIRQIGKSRKTGLPRLVLSFNNATIWIGSSIEFAKDAAECHLRVAE